MGQLNCVISGLKHHFLEKGTLRRRQASRILDKLYATTQLYVTQLQNEYL